MLILYTRESLIYTEKIERATPLILKDFFTVYGNVNSLNIISPPKQKHGAIQEWVGSFSYFEKRNPQWDKACQQRSQFLMPFAKSFPKGHLLGLWFSAILPGGVIQWHVDKYDEDEKYVRVHLPLIVPVGDLGITVQDKTHVWEQGRLFCFDPSAIHTAWNKTDQIRLNLNFNFSRKAFKW